MTDYIEKALEGDYKDFIKSLIKIVGNEIDRKKIPLRDATDLIVREAFYEMRGDKSSLDKLMLSANEVLDPLCQDDMELEDRTVDKVVEEISRNEIYMSEKTRTLPRPDRIWLNPKHESFRIRIASCNTQQASFSNLWIFRMVSGIISDLAIVLVTLQDVLDLP